MDFNQAKYLMVERQIRPWDVLNPEVLEAFMSINRHEFVDDKQKKLAYSDVELPLANEQNMLHPKIEARMLQTLEINANTKVLEIGTGCGFMTAILATNAKEVTTIEIYENLQQQAKQRLNNFSNIKYILGNALDDWNDYALYDAIILTGSVTRVPQHVMERLNIHGRLVVIEGQAPVMICRVYTRLNENEWYSEEIFETVVKPLCGNKSYKKFDF